MESFFTPTPTSSIYFSSFHSIPGKTHLQMPRPLKDNNRFEAIFISTAPKIKSSKAPLRLSTSISPPLLAISYDTLCMCSLTAVYINQYIYQTAAAYCVCRFERAKMQRECLRSAKKGHPAPFPRPLPLPLYPHLSLLFCAPLSISLPLPPPFFALLCPPLHLSPFTPTFLCSPVPLSPSLSLYPHLSLLSCAPLSVSLPLPPPLFALPLPSLCLSPSPSLCSPAPPLSLPPSLCPVACPPITHRYTDHKRDPTADTNRDQPSPLAVSCLQGKERSGYLSVSLTPSIAFLSLSFFGHSVVVF